MNEINLYDVECLTNFENIYNFEKIWSGVFILDRNNFFYGIGKTNIGYKFLMIRVYLPERELNLEHFNQIKIT